MKTVKTWKRLFCLCLAVLMLLSIAACGNKTNEGGQTSAAATTAAQSQSETTAADKKPVTLTLFGESGMMPSSGVQNDPVSLQIAKETGVTLENVPGDKDKLKIMAAGGDLPDIIEMHESTVLTTNFITSGLVIPLDELLESNGQAIKAAIPTALKASKLVLTPTKDKTYFIPTNVQKADLNNPKFNGFVGFFTRWDVYKAIGAPKITNEDEYLAVLKKMVDHQPKTADGKKVYALSGWIDWGLWPYTISYPFAHGYTNGDGTSVNCESINIESNYLEENNIFWRALKFFNKANQLGIFDPEAFTMKYPQYEQKIQSGQVLVSAANWLQPDKSILGNEAGMYIIPGTNEYISQISPEDNLLGYMGGNSLAISAKCKYPDRAMDVLNYINTDEGARLILNGIKGVDWDVKDSKPVLLGKLLENVMSGGAKEPDYTKPGNVNGIGRYGFLVVQDANNPAADGTPLKIANSIDFKIQSAQAADKDFAQYYGGPEASYPGQAYVKMLKDGLVKKVPTSYPMAGGLTEPRPDEQSRIMSKADQYMNANIAKLILAKNDAEFTEAVKKAIADLKAMGVEEVFAGDKERFNKAKSLAEEINK